MACGFLEIHARRDDQNSNAETNPLAEGIDRHSQPPCAEHYTSSNTKAPINTIVQWTRFHRTGVIASVLWIASDVPVAQRAIHWTRINTCKARLRVEQSSRPH